MVPGWADGKYRLEVAERAAQSLSVKIRPRAISEVVEANNIFAAMKADGADVVVVQSSPFTFRYRDQLIEFSHEPRPGDDFCISLERHERGH